MDDGAARRSAPAERPRIVVLNKADRTPPARAGGPRRRAAGRGARVGAHRRRACAACSSEVASRLDLVAASRAPALRGRGRARASRASTRRAGSSPTRSTGDEVRLDAELPERAARALPGAPAFEARAAPVPLAARRWRPSRACARARGSAAAGGRGLRLPGCPAGESCAPDEADGRREGLETTSWPATRRRPRRDFAKLLAAPSRPRSRGDRPRLRAPSRRRASPRRADGFEAVLARAPGRTCRPSSARRSVAVRRGDLEDGPWTLPAGAGASAPDDASVRSAWPRSSCRLTERASRRPRRPLRGGDAGRAVQEYRARPRSGSRGGGPAPGAGRPARRSGRRARGGRGAGRRSRGRPSGPPASRRGAERPAGVSRGPRRLPAASWPRIRRTPRRSGASRGSARRPELARRCPRSIGGSRRRRALAGGPRRAASCVNVTALARLPAGRAEGGGGHLGLLGPGAHRARARPRHHGRLSEPHVPAGSDACAGATSRGRSRACSTSCGWPRSGRSAPRRHGARATSTTTRRSGSWGPGSWSSTADGGLRALASGDGPGGPRRGGGPRSRSSGPDRSAGSERPRDCCTMSAAAEAIDGRARAPPDRPDLLGVERARHREPRPRVATRRRYPKDTVVFFENEEGDFFFMIVEGRIKVTILGDDGREIILSRARARATSSGRWRSSTTSRARPPPSRSRRASCSPCTAPTSRA